MLQVTLEWVWWKLRVKTSHQVYIKVVQSRFLIKDNEYHLERSNHYEFHERKGHHIKKCIEFCQKVARMLTL